MSPQQQRISFATGAGRTSGSLWPTLIITAATTAAYHNSFRGAWMLDDKRQILDNPRVIDPWSGWEAVRGPRPVVDLTLAMNYAIGGDAVRGYHLVNLAVHVAGALALFGLLRRTLETASSRAAATRPQAWYHSSATCRSLAVSLLWAVHPLQTQSVTYLIQRAESLMGSFYLLTLYGLIRGAEPQRTDDPSRSSPRAWYAAAIASCALGMASKGVMVTAPIIALLFDRACLAASWREVLRRRWLVHAGLAATWLVLLLCEVAQSVLDTTNPRVTVGFSYRGVTPLDYALAQPGVILHYLRLSVWPWPLCLDYGWPAAGTIGGVVPQLLAVAGVLGMSVLAWRQRPALGFLGLAFFLVLAPTSSVIPIRDLAFEHRMYLPLAAVVTLMVVGGASLLDSMRYGVERHAWCWRLLGAVPFLAVLPLAAATMGRNEDYRDTMSMWRQIVTLRPHHARARYNLGTILLERNQLDEAVREFEATLQLQPLVQYPHVWAQAHYQIAKVRSRQGREEEAASHYVEAIQIDNSLGEAHSDLGVFLMGRGRTEEAILRFREAVRVRPDYAPAYFNLGRVLLELGKAEEALASLRQAAALSPNTARVHLALGEALLRLDRKEEAERAFQTARRLDPNLPRRTSGN